MKHFFIISAVLICVTPAIAAAPLICIAETEKDGYWVPVEAENTFSLYMKWSSYVNAHYHRVTGHECNYYDPEAIQRDGRAWHKISWDGSSEGGHVVKSTMSQTKTDRLDASKADHKSEGALCQSGDGSTYQRGVRRQSL